MNATTLRAKTVHAGTIRICDKTAYVFCRIEYDGTRLSITGVEGPLHNGDAIGGCGQILGTLRDPSFTPKEGFDAGRFADIWERWHLNDMRAGSPAQMAYIRDNMGGRGRTYETTLAALNEAGLNPDPSNGYTYGKAWLTEDVPDDVIAWLFSDAVPVSQITPAWV